MSNPSNKPFLEEALRSYAAREMPRDNNLWPRISRQLRSPANSAVVGSEPSAPSASTRRARPAAHSRLTTVTAATAALLLISILAYAMAPILSHQPQSYSGIGSTAHTALDPDGLLHDGIYRRATTLNLSQTAGNYTVTLRQVYADRLIFVVRYDISGSDPEPLVSDDVVLAESSGQSFYKLNQVETASTVNGVRTLKVASYYNTANLASSFSPPTFQVHMGMNLLRLKGEASAYPPRSLISGEPLWKANGDVTAVPFNFNFSVPFDKELREVDINQTVVAADITMTLGSVMFTPGEARTDLHFTQPNSDMGWLPIATISATDGPVIASEQKLRLMREGADVTSYIFTAPLYDTGTSFTLDVAKLHGANAPFNPTIERDILGPWVYNFSLPTGK